MTIASWQLYDLDACEAEFYRIVKAAITTPECQFLRSRMTQTNTTPRIEIVLKTEVIQGQRHILNPSQLGQFQPTNVWNFTLGVAVSTVRGENGDQHSTLVAKAREQMQLYKLAQTWTQEVFTVVDIVEQPEVPTVDDAGNIDTTTMTFQGMLAIREGAWSSISAT